jgi:hypothetical protein
MSKGNVKSGYAKSTSFKSGTAEEWLKQKSALNEIQVRLNIQEPADKFCMARRR